MEVILAQYYEGYEVSELTYCDSVKYYFDGWMAIVTTLPYHY